jgi:hypothetical protein
VQPVGQSIGGPEFGDEARNVVSALPAARRALDAQHLELADQSADRQRVPAECGRPAGLF